MRESGVQIKWKKFLSEHPPSKPEVYELKFVNYEKSKSFAFNRLAEHQERALSDSLTGLYYKIGDTASIGGFVSPKPFDCFYLTNVEGYVVIVSWLNRKFTRAYKIPIEKFKMVRDSFVRNGQKSLKIDKFEQFFECEVFDI